MQRSALAACFLFAACFSDVSSESGSGTTSGDGSSGVADSGSGEMSGEGPTAGADTDPDTTSGGGIDEGLVLYSVHTVDLNRYELSADGNELSDRVACDQLWACAQLNGSNVLGILDRHSGTRPLGLTNPLPTASGCSSLALPPPGFDCA